MKGNINLYLWIFFVIVIGLVFVTVIPMKMNPLYSTQGRAQELAITVAMHLDSLSSVEEGSARITTQGNKYDVTIKNDKGYVVEVTAAGEKDKSATKSFPIRSYDTSRDYGISFSGVETVCIDKKAGDSARVIKCAS